MQHEQDEVLTPALLLVDEPPPWTDAELARQDSHVVVRSERQAAFAMATLAALRERIALINETHEAWAVQVEDSRLNQTESLVEAAAFIESRLQRWALATRELDGRKSFPMPFGEVTTRETQPEVVIVDEAAVVEWAGESLREPEYSLVIKTTLKPLVSELRKMVEVVYDSSGDAHILYSGDPVPGLALTPGATTASVKPTS